VQSQAQFEFQIKFSPTPAIMEACREYLDETKQFIRIPYRVQVPAQALPVWGVFCARLTTAVLTLSTRQLDFGFVPIDEAASALLTVNLPALFSHLGPASLCVCMVMALRIERWCAQVTNESALPQRIGFTAPNSVTVPREIAVSPLHGFAHLLPAESKTFNITFSPEIAADFASAIVIKNELGHIQRIGLSAKVSRCFRVGFFARGGDARTVVTEADRIARPPAQESAAGTAGTGAECCCACRADVVTAHARAHRTCGGWPRVPKCRPRVPSVAV
jgi:hypothetical protein